MKGWPKFVALAVMAQALVFAQQSENSPTLLLAFENGSIANNIYTNECLGLAVPIPVGWQLDKQSGISEVRAKHSSPKSLTLLMLDKMADGSTVSKIALEADDAKAFAPSVQQFVSNTVQGRVGLDPEHRELMKNSSNVEYGGKSFFRSGYKQTRNGDSFYIGLIYTKFRDYYLGLTIMAKTAEQVEEAEHSLGLVSFGDDNPNSKCVMRDGYPEAARLAQVHLVKGESRDLRIKTVPPDYPPIARQARVQGIVFLHAVIDKNGDIKDLTLISGHPMLAPAAMKAVKEWKYKRYVLDGQPVEVETQIEVAFSLSGG
jgi:TonB family protein